MRLSKQMGFPGYFLANKDSEPNSCPLSQTPTGLATLDNDVILYIFKESIQK